MIDYRSVKLGRRGIKHSAKLRQAANQLLPKLPPPPLSIDNLNGKTGFGVMLNDKLGCCVISGLGHSVQLSTLNTGEMITPADSIVLEAYERYCGYVPGNDSTDQGGVELDVLAAIAKDGAFAGDKLLGYVSPDPKNWDHVRKAIAYFGSVYVGANLPLSAQTQKVWTPASGSNGEAGSWGGHCMVCGKYDHDRIPFITWGEVQQATWAWFFNYVDEVHCLLWESWLKKFPASTQQTVLSIMKSIA